MVRNSAVENQPKLMNEPQGLQMQDYCYVSEEIKIGILDIIWKLKLV